METLTKEEYNFLKTIDTLNLALDKARDKTSALENQNGELKRELETANSNSLKIKADLQNLQSSYDKTIKELQDSNQTLNINFAQSKVELDKSKAEIIELQNRLKIDSETISKLETELKQKIKIEDDNSKSEEPFKIMERAIREKVNNHKEKRIHKDEISNIIGRIPQFEERIGEICIRRIYLGNDFYRII